MSLPGEWRWAGAGTGRRWLAWAVAFVAVTAVVAAAAAGNGGSRGSTISRGPGGWLAARRYLQARGARVTSISEPLAAYVAGEAGEAGEPGAPGRLRPPRGPRLPDEPPSESGQTSPSGRRRSPGGRQGGPGVLALVFPWQGLPGGDLDEAIDAHLGRGGDLLLAYSGEEAGAERLLGIWRWRQIGKVPLAPWRWRSYIQREWRLQPAAGRGPGHDPEAAPAPPGREAGPAAAAATIAAASGATASGERRVLVWAPRVLPQVGPGTRVLFTAPGGQPAVTVFRYHGGRVVMLPADALSNGRLGEAGNADLLETLRRNLGPRWAFDEYHHGLVTAAAENAGLGRAADLLLAHLILFYLLAVLALARRQGPAWREPATIGGSPAGFLLGLGALHHRLGHHGEAARLLLRRARELDRGLELSPDLDRRAASAGPRELVEIARQVARRRAGHPADDSGETR